MKTNFILVISALFLICSCKKEQSTIENNSVSKVIKLKQGSKEIFSLALAKALKSEKSVRDFLKEESLKMFDNDHDVLFQMVADKTLSNGVTFYNTLLKYSSSKEEFDEAINNLPLMTILVPSVPNFSSLKWDTNLEVPKVAVEPIEKSNNDVIVYDSNGEVSKIPFNEIPGYPIVVVKENERIRVIENGNDQSPQSTKLLMESRSGNSNEKLSVFSDKKGKTFLFANKAFDNFNNQAIQNPISVNRSVDINAGPSEGKLDPSVISAYNLGLEWPRDYIYYGLNPSSGAERGPLKTHIYEYITAIKMVNNIYSQIADQTEDPQPIDGFFRPRPGGIVVNGGWTDGFLEIRISILISAKNGVGDILNKVFSIDPERLYNLNYHQVSGTSNWVLDDATPITCYLNEPIVNWNLQNYGSAWKFIVSEYDLSEEVTETKTNSSTFSTNFEFDTNFGENVKVGTKFGGSSSSTQSSSFTYKTSLTSDDLGEGVLEFSSPIIIGTHDETVQRGRFSITTSYYDTFDVSTGSVLLSIEPRDVL